MKPTIKILCLLMVIAHKVVASNPETGTNKPGNQFGNTAVKDANVWKVSTTLPAAYHQYYDVPAWNCDGSRLLVRREDNRDVYLVSSVGANPERIHTHARMGRFGDCYVQWDAKLPEMFYYVAFDLDAKGTYLVKQSLKGEMSYVFIHENELRLAVPHPDGDHLLFHPPLKQGYNAIIYSLKEGTKRQVRMPGNVHRVRFTKHPDLSLFCNLNETVGGWIITPEGESAHFYPSQAGHPDWSPDGERFSFFAKGFKIADRAGKITGEVGHNINGHQSWSYDGKTVVVDVYNEPSRLHHGHIVLIDTETLTVRPVLPHRSLYTEKQSSHPHPHLSPDGTKVVFNSNNGGNESPQVYVAMVKKPQGVNGLNLVKSNGGKVTLNWKMPQSSEIGSVAIRTVDQNGIIKTLATSTQDSWTGTLPDGTREVEVVTRERFGTLGTPSIIRLP